MLAPNFFGVGKTSGIKLAGTARDVSVSGLLRNCWLSLYWSGLWEILNRSWLSPCAYLSHAPFLLLSQIGFVTLGRKLTPASVPWYLITVWPWWVTCWIFAYSLPVFICLTSCDLCLFSAPSCVICSSSDTASNWKKELSSWTLISLFCHPFEFGYLLLGCFTQLQRSKRRQNVTNNQMPKSRSVKCWWVRRSGVSHI